MSTIYFWRETQPNWGFLSQWYSSPFHAGDPNRVFNCAEQYMMYSKAMLFEDYPTGAKIMATKSPKAQKSLGRKVKNFDEKKWNEHKSRIVEEGSYHKFTKSISETEDMKALLLATGDRELVEASPYDRIWGIGFVEADAEDCRADWGENLLGKALEKARASIRSKEAETASKQ